MSTQFTYPGVYIEEFAPAAPIQGVGTSTAAFIGPAASGDINIPVKITSMDQFMATFGTQPLDGFYLWYAVRGFFENGGQVCYVVRASNGKYSEMTLDDSVPSPNNLPVIRIRARQPGNLNPVIQVSVASAQLVTASVYRPQSDQYTVTGVREVTLATTALAAQFRPGDSVNLGALNDHMITRISGTVFRFADDLNAPLNTVGLIRLSDALAGTTTLRLTSANPIVPGTLVPGTMLTISQGVSDTQMVDSVQAEHLATSPALTTYRVTFRRGINILVAQSSPASVDSREFSLTVQQGASTTVHHNLSVDPSHPRYFPTIVNGDTLGLVWAYPVEPLPPVAPPLNLPVALGATAMPNATDEDLTLLGDTNYTDALDALRQLNDVNMVAIPDCVTIAANNGSTLAVEQAMITHCEQTGDRLAILDSQPGLKLFGGGSIEEQRQGLDSARGYAALYYPWLRAPAVRPGPPILLPPSGHVCGIIARSDANRGVHKAPANELVSGALGVDQTMSDTDQGQLNIQGINVIRQFTTNGRPTLWGARTTATDTNWQYVNVRRLFLFLEKSIQEGIRWAVFEPNNQALWKKLNRTITDFLTRVWRDGALFGQTADQAFYVRIDETLNPDSSRALGRLYIQIGVRPSYPAEFIIVRIGIWQGGSEVVEG